MNHKWNAKVKCTQVYKCCHKSFTEGKVYSVTDGRIVDDRGEVSYSTYDSLAALNESLYAEFELITKDDKA